MLRHSANAWIQNFSIAFGCALNIDIWLLKVKVSQQNNITDNTDSYKLEANASLHSRPIDEYTNREVEEELNNEMLDIVFACVAWYRAGYQSQTNVCSKGSHNSNIGTECRLETRLPRHQWSARQMLITGASLITWTQLLIVGIPIWMSHHLARLRLNYSHIQWKSSKLDRILSIASMFTFIVSDST